MSTSGQRRLFFLFGIVPHVASVFAILVGMLVVAGWVFDVGVLKSVLPGLTAMKMNTAVALILAGLSLLGSQFGARPLLKIAALACGGIVFLIGVLTLGEYFAEMNLGIDELVVRDITNLPGDIPGRMALNTAASFTALGAALSLLNFNMKRLDLAVHGFAIVPILLGGAAFIGYAYDVEALLREHMNYTPMAMNASVALTFLGLGVVSARPGYPFRQFLGSGTAAGTIARRIFPMAILFVFAAGWLILRGYRAGYFRETVGLAIFAAAVMVSVGALILWSTGLIYDADKERKQVEEELRSASQYTRSLIEASVDPLVTISAEGRITDVNEATVQATGIPRNRLIGTDFSEYFTEPDRARAGYQEVFAKGFVRDYPLTLRHISGGVANVLYNASVYKDAHGNILGVFAAARDVTQLNRAENALRERVKELQAFYMLSELAERQDLSLAQAYQELANALPASWQYPEIACVRITLDNGNFLSANFRESQWMLRTPIKVFGETVGEISVGYLEHRPERDEGPFLTEERRLLNAIAERVGHLTERTRAERELRAASQYTRSLIEASLDPLVTISPDGKITDVNEATIQATGVPRGGLIGTDFSEYFTEPEKARAGYREVFQKGEVRDYPLSIRHRDGRVMDVLYNASVYRNPEGEVAGVFAAARDITERKKAENEIRELNRTLERRVEERTAELEQANTRLKRSTTFLENLIESIPGPMFYKDRQGSYLGGNEAFFSYIGLPRERVVGQTVYGISPKHLADIYKKADDELMERGGKQVYESPVRYADGTEHDVIFHKATYPNPDGSVGGLIGIILDISERKQHEQERERLLGEIERRAAELDVANKDLEGFAYSVSHDLRVPLRAIDGFSHQLLKRYEGKLDEEGARYLNIVRDNTKKMSQLIDDILAFSRMGRLGMSVTEVNMVDLVNDVLDELKPALAGRDVQVEVGALPACHADPAMLRQVWVNLISNAIKFTRPRPSAHIELGGHREDNEQVYYAKDNGVGFDMAYADKLFGVFQRLHGVEEFEGTGIGLAIVKRVIARHGGRVWAESRVNEGAAFYFSLPA